MPRAPRTTRAASVCDRVKPSPLSPTGSETGHHLRSRKNINYMTPPLEEDSLTDIEPVHQECRELRSSARLLTVRKRESLFVNLILMSFFLFFPVEIKRAGGGVELRTSETCLSTPETDYVN